MIMMNNILRCGFDHSLPHVKEPSHHPCSLIRLLVIYFSHVNGHFDPPRRPVCLDGHPLHKRKEGPADRTRFMRAGPVMGHPPMALNAKTPDQ